MELLECEFWSKLIDRLARDYRTTPDSLCRTFRSDVRRSTMDSLPSQARYLATSLSAIYLNHRSLRPVVRTCFPGTHARVANIVRMYDYARDISGRRLLVDSSKHPLRMKLLYAARPETTRVVYLTRDGRGHARSTARRDGSSIESASSLWFKGNKHALRMLGAVDPKHYIQVSYEEICRSFPTALARICGLAEIDCLVDEMQLRKGVRHNIAGNYHTRFEGKTKIEEDVRWRSELSADDLDTFERIGGALNRRLMGDYYVP